MRILAPTTLWTKVGQVLTLPLGKTHNFARSRISSVSEHSAVSHKDKEGAFMKRRSNVFEKIITMENLLEAHKKARKGKRHYREVKMVDRSPLKYLRVIQTSLVQKTFTTSPYDVYTINDSGKERVIHKLPYYPDRIVQWAIMLQIEKDFLNTFIYDTYAAIPRRGMHLALKRLQRSMEHRDETKYCLKFDVKKYFPSIDTDILKGMLRKKFKDPDLLWLLDDVIDSTEGIPIGNYTSQYFGNFYLSYFDHWMKEELKCRHYFRYMDDVVILHHDKEHLHNIKNSVADYLANNLSIRLKENWQVFPTYVRGVDFVGYRSFGDYTLLRKSTAKRLKKKMGIVSRRDHPTDVNSIMSYSGWLKHCDAYNLHKRYIRPRIEEVEKCTQENKTDKSV